MFDASRSDIEFHGLAVGGSSIVTLSQRLDAVLALKPDLVSIYIGANDISIKSKYPTADHYIAALKAFVDPIRATGARVIICTLMPKRPPSDYNAIRNDFNAKIRKVDWIDGLADFGADPTMGPDDAPLNLALYQADGVHPTGLGHSHLYAVYKPAMDKLVADVR